VIKKEQILHTALELFNEKGYADVGVRELARVLQISPGNLSYHFSKKEDILMALLEQFSGQNSSFYEQYYALTPTNARFLELMHRIFDSQYQYRGVYIGNQFVQAELQRRDRFDYQSVAAKRVATFQKIFKGLDAAGHISVNEEDITFLVSYITLFGRFWISEATLFNKTPDKQKTIQHYLLLLARQLSLFATEEGKESIDTFCSSIA
jgi:AcrR family transcriptional regulator